MIPLQRTQSQFRDATLEFLAEGLLTPDDLLVTLRANLDTQAVYVPFMRNLVSYHGDMHGMTGREVINYVTVTNDGKQVPRKKVDIVWDPFTQPVQGKFRLDVCLSCGIEDRLAEQLQLVTIGHQLKPFDPQLIGGCIIESVAQQLEPDELFQARGYELLSKHVHTQAKSVFPSLSLGTKVTFDYSLDQATPFIAGYWMLSYNYKGGKYKLFMDSVSGKVIGDRPEDSERAQWLRELSMMGHFSWLPAILAVYLGFLVVAWVPILVGYALSLVLKNKVRVISRETRAALCTMVKTQCSTIDMSQLIAKAQQQYVHTKQLQHTVAISYVLFSLLVVALFLVAAAGYNVSHIFR